MQIIENESLKKYTTVKIGGIARKLYFPESIQELIDLVETIINKKFNILSGGSNLLINDQKVFDDVISLKMMDSSIEKLGNGKYYVGSSVKLQKLINHINDDGYGGIEYLYSVPALLGGAVVMNAGRGKVHNLNISDYIEDVHIYDYNEGVLKILDVKDCEFNYRSSIFKANEMIVLGVTFCFDSINREEALRKKQDRIELVKKVQDGSGYNFGSVFREYNKYIMQLVKISHPGYKGGMSYSKKTSNWLINQGEGTYTEACSLINKVVKIHSFLGLKAVPEVIKWE